MQLFLKSSRELLVLCAQCEGHPSGFLARRAWRLLSYLKSTFRLLIRMLRPLFRLPGGYINIRKYWRQEKRRWEKTYFFGRISFNTGIKLSPVFIPRKYNIFENSFSTRVRHRLDNFAFFRKHVGLATAKYRFLHNHEIGPLKKNLMYKLGPSCSKGNLRRPGIKQQTKVEFCWRPNHDIWT